MNVAIIDYGSGNLRSAAKSFERAAREAGLAARVMVTADAKDVAGADRIVLPGVGAFGDCRAGLDRLAGIEEALDRAVMRGGRPFLGICVGMQLMGDLGLEHGRHPGLGWIAGEVVPIEAPGLKIPHMGWNELGFARPHPLTAGLEVGAHAYFVHSYRFEAKDAASVVATTDYGGAIVAIVARDNLAGTQFHPEKSQATGLRLIANFLRWRP